MKSNKGKNGKLNDRIINAVFTPDFISKTGEENLKGMLSGFLLGLLTVIIVSIGLNVSMVFFERKTTDVNQTKVKQEELQEGEYKLEFGESNQYIIDTLNSKYIKMPMIKMDGQYVYSLTYSDNSQTDAPVKNTSYLNKYVMSTILINGYPNVSYSDMGLQSEEEAYIATQLAVFELSSRYKYSKSNNESFSLERIRASKDEYKDMMNRVIPVAQNLVNKAINEPYEYDSTSDIDKSRLKSTLEDGAAIFGPMTTSYSDDEYVKKILNPQTHETKFIVGNIKGETIVVDKDGNKIDKINTGDEYYFKSTTPDQFAAIVVTEIYNTTFASRIYSTGKLSDKKEYVRLESKDIITKYDSLYNRNVETATIDIDFVIKSGEEKKELAFGYYKIFDEEGKEILEVDGYKLDNKIKLPLGKYSVKQYQSHDDRYLINLNKYEFELKDAGETVKLEIPIQALK